MSAPAGLCKRGPAERSFARFGKARAHVGDDGPDVLPRQRVLECRHPAVELLTAVGDAPQQILVDRDRFLHEEGEERRRGQKRLRGDVGSEPRRPMAGGAMSLVKAAARLDGRGRAWRRGAGVRIGLGHPAQHVVPVTDAGQAQGARDVVRTFALGRRRRLPEVGAFGGRGPEQQARLATYPGESVYMIRRLG